ncbi:MAG: acyl carrier protein [Clostridia bacterium]|nr:acyl carrier protein [Clostridia bacterium]
MDSLIEILSSLHPDIDFTTATGLIEDGILDSFDIITLVAEIDDVFDVQIPAEELVPENFNTAQDLYNLIKRLEDD